MQRFVYLANALAVLHFAWLLKEPGAAIRYGVVVALLLVLRLPPVARALRDLRKRVRKQKTKS